MMIKIMLRLFYYTQNWKLKILKETFGHYQSCQSQD